MGLLEDLLLEELPMQVAAAAPEALAPTMPAVGPARLPTAPASSMRIGGMDFPYSNAQAAAQLYAANRNSPTNPDTGLPWGQYSEGYEAERVKGLQTRDKTQMGIMEVIGRLDPSYQAAILQRLGIPVKPGNTKLDQAMMEARMKHSLGAPERAETRDIRREQVMANIQNMSAQQKMAAEMNQLRAESVRTQRINALERLGRTMETVRYTNPEYAKELAKLWMSLAKSLDLGEGGETAPTGSAPQPTAPGTIGLPQGVRVTRTSR